MTSEHKWKRETTETLSDSGYKSNLQMEMGECICKGEGLTFLSKQMVVANVRGEGTKRCSREGGWSSFGCHSLTGARCLAGNQISRIRVWSFHCTWTEKIGN